MNSVVENYEEQAVFLFVVVHATLSDAVLLLFFAGLNRMLQ